MMRLLKALDPSACPSSSTSLIEDLYILNRVHLSIHDINIIIIILWGLPFPVGGDDDDDDGDKRVVGLK